MKKSFLDACSVRPIALKVLYLGWNYHGLVVQKSTGETVERYLIDALKSSKLVKDIDNCRFSRSGRTDKGVCAFSQIFGLDITSRLDTENINDLEKELPYPKMINRFLPKDIIVLGWCPTKPDFSARFDCTFRHYKYFFPLNGMNVEAMREAASLLIGSHDFKNFCKIDKTKENPVFVRDIFETGIEPVEEGSDVHVFSIKGSGFLHHQVRCIMGTLFSIGRGLDSKSVIETLFDTDTVKSKPGYDMASEHSLVLYDCGYEPKLDFIYHTPFLTPLEELEETFRMKHQVAKAGIAYIKELTGDSAPSFHGPILTKSKHKGLSKIIELEMQQARKKQKLQ